MSRDQYTIGNEAGSPSEDTEKLCHRIYDVLLISPALKLLDDGKLYALIAAHDEAVRSEARNDGIRIAADRARRYLDGLPYYEGCYTRGLHAAITADVPTQDAKAAQKAADDRAYAWRHEMMGDAAPKVREALERLNGFTYHAADNQDAEDIKTVCAALSTIDPEAIRAEALREERGRCEDIVCALWPNKDAIRFAILAGGQEEREAEPCGKCVERKGAQPCEFCGPPAWEAYQDRGEMEASVRDGMSRSTDALRRSMTSWHAPEVMPAFMVYRDGDMFCAVTGHFRNLQESSSGWGRTPVGALVDLIEGRAKDASPEVTIADEPKECEAEKEEESLQDFLDRMDGDGINNECGSR